MATAPRYWQVRDLRLRESKQLTQFHTWDLEHFPPYQTPTFAAQLHKGVTSQNHRHSRYSISPSPAFSRAKNKFLKIVFLFTHSPMLHSPACAVTLLFISPKLILSICSFTCICWVPTMCKASIAWWLYYRNYLLNNYRWEHYLLFKNSLQSCRIQWSILHSKQSKSQGNWFQFFF